MSVVISKEQVDFTWDSLSKTWEQALFSWDEAGLKNFTTDVDEPLTAEDKCLKGLDKFLGDKVRILDNRPFTEFGKMLYETFGIRQTYWDNIHFNLYFVEECIVTDSKSKNITKQVNEKLVLREAVAKMVTAFIFDVLGIKDQYERKVVYERSSNEDISFIEHEHKSLQIFDSEALSVSDDIKKSLQKLTSEEVAIAEDFLREFIVQRVFSENIDVQDFCVKALSLEKQESLDVYDALIRACDGVLSNILITEMPMSVDEFKKYLNSPPNYTGFIRFKVGEYEYEEALVRISLSSSAKQSKPGIANVVMHVDIPDTDDRGEVVVTDTSAPTKVYFNKFYYNPPEVNVTLKAANTSDGVLIPNIVSTEGKDELGRYFEVELWNENWSERKTGRLSWVSKGY